MQARIPPYGRSALNNTIPQLLLLSKSKALHASEVFFGFKSCGIWGYFAKKTAPMVVPKQLSQFLHFVQHFAA